MENTNNSTEPLIDRNIDVAIGGGEKSKLWWNKVFDGKEAKDQVLFALPMILTNCFYYLITLISVMFAGHLGELELAGATLGNSWSIVTGLGVMTGLCGALETLCGQSFGALQYRMLGVHLQGSCVISLIFCIIISIIWWFTEPILILLNQEADIAKTSALYLHYFIPGLFAYGMLQNLLRFLQMQSVVWPLVWLSGIPTAIHVGIAYALVKCTDLGFIGAPLSASISLWLCTFVMAAYILFSSKFKHTWTGFSIESLSLRHLWTILKLALPSTAMVCLEFWAFELLVLIAGMLSDAETSTSLIAMCVNTEAIAFNCIYGLSATASTRVSNELGAGNPEKAKHAMGMTLRLSLLVALIFDLFLGFGHNFWASLFSSSSTIISAFASISPLILVSVLFDSIQGALSGAVRGCGWQNSAALANLATFYFIGMPIAACLAFKTALQAKGLWVGLICGLASQTLTLFIIMMRSKWARLDILEDHHGGSLEHSA